MQAPTPPSSRLGTWTSLVVALALAALPLVLTPYTFDLVVKIAIYAVFALSLELLVGGGFASRAIDVAFQQLVFQVVAA